jgi:hypothetical protein
MGLGFLWQRENVRCRCADAADVLEGACRSGYMLGCMAANAARCWVEAAYLGSTRNSFFYPNRTLCDRGVKLSAIVDVDL